MVQRMKRFFMFLPLVMREGDRMKFRMMVHQIKMSKRG